MLLRGKQSRLNVRFLIYKIYFRLNIPENMMKEVVFSTKRLIKSLISIF